MDEKTNNKVNMMLSFNDSMENH